MKLISRKCGICSSWYRPLAHSNHCPICGVFPINYKNQTLHFNGVSMRRVVSVSARTIPSVLFHSDLVNQARTRKHFEVR
jgi:hypothetical protein